jgi:hypothetical protein
LLPIQQILLQEELTRTGVELPEFRKLGGMLSDEGGARGSRKNDKHEAIFEGDVIVIIFYVPI